MSETRKLAAILVADVVGYSRLAGADEDRTLVRLRGLRSDLIDPAIAAHHGRIVKRTGDGSIIEFRSVVDAVRCAIEVQNGLIERNAGVSEDRRIEFRVGIHVGDVVEESDGDLMGDGVNIAARLAQQPAARLEALGAFALLSTPNIAPRQRLARSHLRPALPMGSPVSRCATAATTRGLNMARRLSIMSTTCRRRPVPATSCSPTIRSAFCTTCSSPTRKCCLKASPAG